MYDLWHIYESVTERHNELLKEAEMERLYRKLKPCCRKTFKGFHILLNNFGKILTRSGMFLQKHYGANCR